MTAETLEIKKKIDKRIAILSPKQLNGLLTLLESFTASASVSTNKDDVAVKDSTGLPPRNPKYGGRRISDEIAAMFITGNGLDATDEELEQMKYEYLTEKYGK